MSVSAALAAGSIALPLLLVLALYRSRRRKQAAPLAACYGGRVSPTGDTVRFDYEGACWEVQRVASGGGLGGTGSYPTLVLALDEATPLVIGPAQAMKYVYALSVPRQHSVLATLPAPLVVAGPSHAAVAAALDTPDAAALLGGLFFRHYSTLRVRRATRLAADGAAGGRWTLRLTGLPEDIYEQPYVLKQFLDNILLLCGRIDLRIHRRVRFA